MAALRRIRDAAQMDRFGGFGDIAIWATDMGGEAKIDLDELNRLVFDCVNEFGPEELQWTALNRIVDILAKRTDYFER